MIDETDKSAKSPIFKILITTGTHRFTLRAEIAYNITQIQRHTQQKYNVRYKQKSLITVYFRKIKNVIQYHTSTGDILHFRLFRTAFCKKTEPASAIGVCSHIAKRSLFYIKCNKKFCITDYFPYIYNRKKALKMVP